MTIGQSQESASRIEDIRRWQIQTYDGDGSIVPTANIAALYDGLITFLKAILTYTRKQRPEPSYLSSLEGSVTTLFFWGRDFGVSQGELDTALQFSNRLRDTILTLLASLGDLLSLGKLIRYLSIFILVIGFRSLASCSQARRSPGDIAIVPDSPAY